MALPTDISRSFRLYVTHVDGEGHFLKISGQLDQPSSLMIESLFESARENLEKGIGAVPPGAIQEGIVCAAKYKDGTYYRAKIISTTNLVNGLVGVHFIDYGNKDIISLSTIRFLNNYDPMFLQLRGQATDYYLSRVMHPSGRWEEPLLLKLQSLLCYSEYPATIDTNTRTLPIISIQFKGNDLSTHLVANRFGIELPTSKQEALLVQLLSPENQGPNWQPNYPSAVEAPSYVEHVPFIVNQNFPSNPASAMRLQQNVTLPFNGSVPPPSLISQRLMVNKVSRAPISLKANMRQPQTVPPFPVQGTNLTATPPSTPNNSNKSPSPKKSTTYKSRLLEVGSQHKVFVSFAEEGPELFAVQLVTDAKKLQDMMDDINRRPHSSLAEPPMIGTVCLGRMSGDRIICRAIVMNLSGSQCKLFFVDFGDTEMVSYYDIFDIPEEFVKPNVFAMRFCLSGVKKLEKGPHLTEAFKQLVNGKVLSLRVVSPEGPPLIQYGELFLDNKSVLDLLMANMKDKLQFKWMEMLALGSTSSVLVSYVDSCIKFYVQLSDTIDDLNAVMDAVKAHCENTNSPGELPIGAACCARFPEDKNWYRARIRSSKGNGKVVVSYVDYGNEQEVDVSDLRTITPDLIRLPAQAMKCALKGYENKPIETKTSNQLEMLALEKTLTAHIVGVLSNDTMLVSLVDETVNPPLDVARRMMQLSTPRSNIEPKVTTPVRKDAPESFSSPESDDGKKKNFRREKSFKEERRPREGNDEFAQRAGSFRSREPKDGFDRSGPGRHSDKFGGRPDTRHERGDRRGPKPWENNASAVSPPAASNDDEWEESPPSTQPAYQSPSKSSRDNRDNNRKKPRPDFQGPRDQHGPRSDHGGPKSDHSGPRPEHSGPRSDHSGSRSDHSGSRSDHGGGKPGWKGKDSGVGRRLRQAAEAASADAQNSQKFFVQDRLKRDNKFNQQNNEWENRPDRRDNRGDRRDNWADKRQDKDFQKRDFRDNNRERGDRNRSNFTPRDRAERSFGSDGDKKSESSFRSGEGKSGRAPAFKPRGKFTQVQYKELPDPAPLDTPFALPEIEAGAQQEVTVAWLLSPASFHVQIVSLQPSFVTMMARIPELYRGVKPYSGALATGSSVLARYPPDGVLYRATVLAAQPFNKFIVRYVDFGNKQLVDARDIWQLDRELLTLPAMAVHCELLGVAPPAGEWKADPEVDLCFNSPRCQCVFQELAEEGRWRVFMWNNGVSVAETLVSKQLAVAADTDSAVALKDEAIDLTIIVGQQILCKVTHVESYDKFYVQLDLDKAALVEKAIADFDTSKLTPLAAENLSEGVHCTVRHEGRVYRAILQQTDDSAAVQAVLPDLGYTITTTLDDLMILPTELSVYYYQSLECGLNNFTEESKTLMSIEELRERLLNNKFIIYINYVDGIRLISTLYDIPTGNKIAIFEPDEGAYDTVLCLCARAVFNYNFGLAYIAHAASLNQFYLQRAADSDRIATLLDDLYKFYEEGTPEPLTEFEVEALCAAKSSDGNWYRATILTVQENDIEVHFSDYGNSETIPKESIKKLDPTFFEPCALALEASLGLVALQDDALSKLLEWTTDKEVQVTLAFGTDGWLASLHLDGVDLSMKLVNEKLATPQVSDAEATEPTPEAPIDSTEEPASLPPGCTQVYISHIDTPGHFWLQFADKVDAIEVIQAELQASADNYPDVEDRSMGVLCAAKYLADELWYRAEILDADADITTVRFVDYGNTDVLDNHPGLLKQLPEHLQATERYALKASVNAVPTGTGEWSEAAAKHFTELVGDLATPLQALVVLHDVTTYVDVFVSGRSLTDQLVAAGHAARSDTPTHGDLPACYASHVNSPAEFWLQLESAAPDLQAMEAEMVNAETFPPLETRGEGQLCAAKYPDDGAWYRAQLVVQGSEGTEVLFMDYGNASIADELRALPVSLRERPALSRKCALQKPREIKAWSRKSEERFAELAAEGATVFKVQFIASGDISIVELFHEGRSVTEELVALCEARGAEAPGAERPPPLGREPRAPARLCEVTSADEFYVQMDAAAPEIDGIISRLRTAADLPAATDLRPGSLCAARWDEDEQWYRAKVLEACDDAHHVLFVDYGNRAKCTEFRKLPDDLVGVEPTARHCRLAGLADRSESTLHRVKEKLDEYAAEATIFEIEFLDSATEPALVRLYIEGRDFSTLFEDDTDAAVAPPVPAEALEQKDAPATAETPVETEEKTEDAHKEAAKEIVKNAGDDIEDVAADQSADVDNVAAEKSDDIENVAAEKSDDIENVAAEKSDDIENVAAEKSDDIENVAAEKSDDIENVAAEKSDDIQNVAAEKSDDIENVAAEKSDDIENVAAEKSDGIENVAAPTENLAADTETKISNDENVVEDNKDVIDVENDPNASQDLNESVDSSSTVIENKSFDGSKGDSSNDEFKDAEESRDPPTPEKGDHSAETLENSNDTIITPERDDSKDSLNTDTGYTSAGDQDKSPLKEETSSIVDVETKEKESVEVESKEIKTETVSKVDEEAVNTAVKSAE